MPARSLGRAVLGAVAVMAAVVTLAPRAAADEFTDQLNNPFKSIATDRRSDLVLIPLLAKLTDPPAGATPAYQAALLPADSAAFKDAAAWAQAAPQKAFLEAIPKVTGEKDWKKAHGFGQPYGTDGVEPEHIAAKAYTDLGDPPYLGRAKHLYLPMMEKAESLIMVESTRLQADGKPDQALELLWRWAHFARSMCDRAFYAEVLWGLKATTLSLEKIRDVAYVDSRLEKPLLTPKFVVDQVIADRLQDRGGILGLDRLKFPSGNQVACAQLVKAVFKNRGAADMDVFPKILAEVTSRGRALRRFSEVARWDSLGKLAGNQLATTEKLEHVQGDWGLRWELSPRDPFLKLRTDYEKLDKVSFAIVPVIIGDLSPLFAERHRLQVELVGTRTALAMQAYWLGQQKQYPRTLGAVVPTYIRKIDGDPYSARKPTPADMLFFVPVRDAIQDKINPREFHEITIFPNRPFGSFKKRLDATQFVIYSVGPDGAQQGCLRASQLVEDDKGDYLIWPPVLSLLRESLQDSGALK